MTVIQQQFSNKPLTTTCVQVSLHVAWVCKYTWNTQPFYGPFSGTTRVSWCQKRTSGLYGASGD